MTLTGTCRLPFFASVAIFYSHAALQAQDTVDLLALSLAELVEIEVTGARTGRGGLNQIPIAITTISGLDIEQTHARDVRDLAHLVPGLVISQNIDYAQIYIRGVGSNNVFAGAEPSATIHLDGVYLARPFGLFDRFHDVERIEVLRGPQGGLYGRNSSAGTINIISKQPNLTENVSTVSASAGTYASRSGSGYISRVLQHKSLAGSLSGQRSSRSGFRKNVVSTGNDSDDENTVSVRSKLLWRPKETFSLRLAADFLKDTSVQYGYLTFLEPVSAPAANSILGDFGRFAGDFPGFTRRINWGVSVEATLKFGAGWQATLLSSYRDNDYSLGLDTDGTEQDILRTFFDEKQDQTSHEITLSKRTDTLFLVAGFYYLKENLALESTVQLRSLGIERRPSPNVETEATAFFGAVQYKPAESITIDFNLRQSWDKKSFLKRDGIFSTSSGALISDLGFPEERRTDSIFTPKFGLSYNPPGGPHLYASVTKGFKSGGYNFIATLPGGFSPETVWSYEVGMKAKWFNNRVETHLTGFRYDYQNLQVQAFIVAGSADISNAADADIAGLELEMRAIPFEGLTIQSSFAFLKATYSNYQDAPVAGGGTVDATDNALNSSPKWSYNLSAQYIHSFGSGSLHYTANLASQSRIFFTADNNSVETQGAYSLLNASFAYHPSDDQYKVSLYGRNILGTQYITGSASFPPSIAGHAGPPATFGLQVSINY